MNLTVLDFWELWLPITHVVHLAFEIEVTPPYELLEYHLNKHLLQNWKKSRNKKIH